MRLGVSAREPVGLHGAAVRRSVRLRRQRRVVSASKTSEITGLVRWLRDEKGLSYSSLEIEQAEGIDASEFVCSRTLESGEAALEFSSDLTITNIDAEMCPEIQSIVKGRSELVQLTLWLLAERQKGQQSPWHPYIQSLPVRTQTPLLWTSKELDEFCYGSQIVTEAKIRRKALLAEWDSLEAAMGPDVPVGFSEEEFLDAFSVVLGNSFYLPSAGRFALLPPLTGIYRTGDDKACSLDYDPEKDKVVVTVQSSYRPGDRIRVFDGRPNTEMFMTTGAVETDNPSDCLYLEYELVVADRLYSAKRQILESLGFQTKETFPIYKERIPSQLLSFLRLSRVQDTNQLSQVSFAEDVIVSQMNEYEVLQLVLGDCRVRLNGYRENIESDLKSLQREDLSEKERLATQLLLEEKQILQSCVDLIRNRLAPIRGVPTKSGELEDPNKDIMDMFNAIESIPQAPKKILDGLIGWAKGDYDPDWNKKRK